MVLYISTITSVAHAEMPHLRLSSQIHQAEVKVSPTAHQLIPLYLLFQPKPQSNKFNVQFKIKKSKAKSSGKRQSMTSPPKELRLLVLSSIPHPLDGEIQCQLLKYGGAATSDPSSTDSLSKYPSYEVMSCYSPPRFSAPGPSVGGRRIWLDCKLVGVSRSLHSGFHALRKRSEWAQVLWVEELCYPLQRSKSPEGQVVWVDELCAESPICDFEQEKTGVVEIKKMHHRTEALKGARGVIVCLGGDEVPAKHRLTKLGTFEIIRSILSPSDIPIGASPAVAADIQDLLRFIKLGKASIHTMQIAQEYWKDITDICRLPNWNQISTIRDMYFAPSVILQYRGETIPALDFIQFLEKYAKSFENLIEYGRVCDSQAWKLSWCMQTKKEIEKRVPSGFLNLLELSRDSICKNRRNKVFQLFALTAEIGETDIEIDYAVPLFDLFGRVLEHFHFKMQEGSAAKILALCQALQRSLLGPDFSDEGFDEMTATRQDWKMDSSFTLPGLLEGQVVGISDNPKDLLGYVSAMQSRRRSAFSRLTFSVLRSSDYKESPKPWEDLLEKGWEMDKGSFALFDKGEKQNSSESAGGMTMFVTDEMELGVAPRGIRKGDLLCRFQGDRVVPFSAIVRQKDGQGKGSKFRAIGRARLRKEAQFDDAIVAKSLGIKREEAKKPKNQDVQVDIGLTTLQALTCPLRFR